MKSLRSTGRPLCSFLCLSALTLCVSSTVRAADPNPGPPIMRGSLSPSGQPYFTFPSAGADLYSLFGSASPFGPFSPMSSNLLSGPSYTVSTPGPYNYFRVSATPMTSRDLLIGIVLNRLTYGASPDDLEHIRSIGPDAFIEEQLRADEIPGDLDLQPPIVNTPPAGPPLTNWIRVSATGIPTGTNFFLYLNAPGKVYVDDVRLVRGNVRDAGQNLLVNGDFESDMTGWTRGGIVSDSVITSSPTPDGLAASGSNCLLLVSTGVGSGTGNSFQQAFTTATNAASTNYTLSFSYLTVGNPGATNVGLVARLSGAGTANSGANRTVLLPWTGVIPTPPIAISPLYAKFTNSLVAVNIDSRPVNPLTLPDLQAYHIRRAVQSRRQLYEILVQFFENHFTTEYDKTEAWFETNARKYLFDDSVRNHLATSMEWREHDQFRKALLNPNCTFYDLLKISFESPAMTIYLDTVLNSKAAANENYAREFLELHTCGADNGYLQSDIVDLAKIWTGWRVAKKAPSVAQDPHAPPVANPTNDFGVWVLHFVQNSHNYTSTKRLFTNNVIDPRFGPGFGGGQPYSLIINSNAFPGTNGMREAYQVAQHVAGLPYAAEFISVKLCRLFVHEGFEFGIYDYTEPTLSPEAQLIKSCMTAWNTPAGDGRKGNLRSVLRTIFSSDLFRGQGASSQKIKTPLELAVSAIRALRSYETAANGYVTSSADTDGYSVIPALFAMGGMELFNKTEPDGYSEFGRIWLNTANLDERWRFAHHLLMTSSYALKDDDYTLKNNLSDPSKLIRQRVPSGSWNDPGALADYLMGLLFPGEGRANLAQDRAAAVAFLNSDDAGQASTFNFAAHDGRVRGMVALLMSLPRFQEQ
jgi:uncharacterized protein (DUF1800 family)